MKQVVFCCLLIGSCLIPVYSQNPEKQVRLLCQFLTDDSTDVENVSVSIESPSYSKQFSPQGSLSVLLPKGKYTMTAQASGYWGITFTISLQSDTAFTIVFKEDVLRHQGFAVKAIQVREKTGFVYSKLDAKQISASNLGQDFTYLLGNTPSSVTTSDAGAGIGYTGIRIRGSDATRINVTINGIPINDAESHGVFWVNMPDLASSTSYVQVQRGVGSSTIGSGAFGANINIRNTELSNKPFVQFQQSVGSFNTGRSTLQFGTGQIGNLNFAGRLSKIISDGYIDRSSSNLQSFQFNLNFNKNKWDIHALSFGGKEKTYQSWYGTPESRIKNDVQAMSDYADRNYLSEADRYNLLNSGRTYNYYTYKNQTDNYWQNHYQLHIVRDMGKGLFLKASGFATQGKGFYEEFKPSAAFSNYGVNDYTNNGDTQTTTDLVRQRWLDNWFYGAFVSATYKRKAVEYIAGLSANQYDGKHFGDVIWAAIAQPFGKDYRYYESKSKKSEINSFLKLNYKFSRKLQLDAELQLRNLNYSSKGRDNDNTSIDFDTAYTFINPKLGVVYELNAKQRIYGSYSIGQREPVRSDFIDNSKSVLPKPEYLGDLEMGYILKSGKRYFQFNLYAMEYKNQLVLTGELNDVGSSLRTNVAKSYRRGIECIVQWPLLENLSLDANLNLSRNKIASFDDIYYNYDSASIIKDNYKNTDIAFSPSIIAFCGITDKHIKGMDLSVNCKYVGKQYLDNTLNKTRILDAYYTLNFSCVKSISFKSKSKLSIKAMVNNITGIFYSNNGYTYKYVYSGILTTENFYYPQSGINFMIGLDFKFL